MSSRLGTKIEISFLGSLFVDFNRAQEAPQEIHELQRPFTSVANVHPVTFSKGVLKGVKRTSYSYTDPVSSEGLLERSRVLKTQDVAAQNMHHEACAKSPAPEPIIHKVNSIVTYSRDAFRATKKTINPRCQFKTCAPGIKSLCATQFEVSTQRLVL